MHGVRGGEPFGYAANFGMNYDLCGFEDTLDRVYSLVSTPLEGYQDLFVHEGLSSLSYENDIPNLLEHSYVSTFCSQPSSSFPNYTYDVPNDIFELSDVNVSLITVIFA